MSSPSPFARAPVLAAAGVQAVLLAVLAPRYGYHRDELYFRMLPPAWGYTDQPPLTPAIARASVTLLGDHVASLRVVPLLCAVGSVLVLALLAREVGGGRLAQTLTAWGMAFATMTLAFGHVLLTASLDLVVWPTALLMVVRALRRDDGRWWLAAGAVIGVSASNKLLVAVLVVGLLLGLAVCGPRRWFRSGWLWGAGGLALLLASPNLVYQATHGWPQLAMGSALGDNNADEVRVTMWPFLVLMVGPVLAVFWVAGLVALVRRPDWREVRLLGVVFVVVLGFVFAAGTQFYYTYGVLAVLVALGAVPVADWASRPGRRRLLGTAVALNGLTCAVTSLPVLPLTTFGDSGLAEINPGTAEQIGWEPFTDTVTDVARAHQADVVITSNYGEAGALDRFADGSVPVVSGHNALGDLDSPPAGASTAVVVGLRSELIAEHFTSCTQTAEIDNGVGVANEEQGQPVLVCRDPTEPWSTLWPRLRHLD